MEPAAVALIIDFAQLPAEERNTVRLSIRLGGTLCSPPAGEEDEFARQAAADLRATSARHPAYRALGELVNEFAAHSPEFATTWRTHDVRPRPTLRERLHHPELGELELECQTLLVPGTDLRLVIYIPVARAPPRSPGWVPPRRREGRRGRPSSRTSSASHQDGARTARSPARWINRCGAPG